MGRQLSSHGQRKGKPVRLLVDKITDTVVELSDAVIIEVPDGELSFDETETISGNWGATAAINLANANGWKVEEV